jgi:sugar/nucleoside kinase (ribokinase family)
MTPHYDVIVAGDYCLDLIFTGLPAFPALGKEVVGTGFAMIPGASYNSAVAMHRLGLKVGWATDFGNDDFSRFVLERVRQEGLDEALLVHHDRPMRRITVAASYPHDRAFIAFYDPEPAVHAAMKALATASAQVLYVSGLYYGSLFDAGRLLVRARHMKLVMDGNSGDEAVLANPAVRKSVQNVEVLMPNASEARRMTGTDDLVAAMQTLAALGPLVVVKDGGNGAYACAGGQIIHAPAIPITPMETTGAGDCFNAGFIKAWLDGRPLAECLRWGNVVGGLSTLAPGGTGKVVTVEEVQRWLK